MLQIDKKTKTQPYARTYFQPSGVNVHVRYFAPATRLQEISSDVTKQVYDTIKKTRGVEIAYHHTEVVFRKKSRVTKTFINNLAYIITINNI